MTVDGYLPRSWRERTLCEVVYRHDFGPHDPLTGFTRCRDCGYVAVAHPFDVRPLEGFRGPDFHGRYAESSTSRPSWKCHDCGQDGITDRVVHDRQAHTGPRTIIQYDPIGYMAQITALLWGD